MGVNNFHILYDDILYDDKKAFLFTVKNLRGSCNTQPV